MPYKLRKAPRNKWGDDAYWVIDPSGKHYSKDPLPRARAREQQKALYAAEGRKHGGADGATAIPTFQEYLASKGIPVGALDSGAEAGDTTTFDQAAYDAAMARMLTPERYAATTKGRSGAQSYGDYSRSFEAIQRQRATKNTSAERRMDYNRRLTDITNKAYMEYIAEYPEAEEIMCNIAADGERLGRPERTTAADCKARHKLNYRKEMEKNPLGKVVTTLTDVADTAADMLPGPLGEAASAVYKQFAPPTSKFGRGRKQPMVTMTRKAFEKEHRKLIKLLETSDDPAIRKEAADQKAEMEKMLGSGIFGDIASGFKKVVGRVSDVFKGVRKDYPPDVRKTLAVIGNQPVVAMSIRRDPIRGMLSSLINFVTLGKWNEARQKYNFDKVFHLGVEITLGDGRIYIAEKNQVLNIAPTTPSNSETERLPVTLPSIPFTVNTMLQRTQQRQGDRYFLYDGYTNNCQDWIVDLLIANGIATPENLAFVKQPLEQVLESLPSYTSTLMRLATNAGAIADVALKGRGRARAHPAFAAQLRETGIKPQEYLAAVRSLAQKNGYNPEDVMFADTPEHKIAIKRPDGGITRAGRVGYGDFILWSFLEHKKKVPAGTAASKRGRFHKSHSKIKGNWKADKFSPNNIALNLLW
jgi:hypothetical protein